MDRRLIELVECGGGMYKHPRMNGGLARQAESQTESGVSASSGSSIVETSISVLAYMRQPPPRRWERSERKIVYPGREIRASGVLGESHVSVIHMKVGQAIVEIAWM